MAINVLVNGAFGRMGQLAVKAIENHPGLNLVGQAGREYNLKQVIIDSKADVVIDFTQPDTVFQNTSLIIEVGSRPVIGTSGLTMEQIQILQKQCAALKRGGVIAPNFSLGAVLMMKLAKNIAPYFSHAEIIEKHHAAKIDSPSGTSMRSAQLIAEGNPNINSETQDNVETLPHARGANHQHIPIHSMRLPGLLAHQEIIFGGQGETLTLKHDSIDRLCFMPGICLACEKVMHLESLVYGLEDVI